MKYSHKYNFPIFFYIIVISILISVAYLGSTAVTAITENVAVDPPYTMIIDAGHGGIDGGATSCTGVLEKDINLEIALRLNDLVNLLGINTKMVRTEDVSVYSAGETISAKKASDLKERVKIVNNTNNGLLISIHQNYYPDSKYCGAQIFYSKSKKSERFAKALQQQFIDAINPQSNRQAKLASGIYLMDHIVTPGVLIECGFLSNYREENLLRTPEYQKKISCVIAVQASQYFTENQLA